MLESSELNIRFHPGWIDEHKKHFLSQLMLIEIKNKNVSILYDGGGFKDRNQIMKNAISIASDCGLFLSSKRFYLFTGDNRPGGIEFDYSYFSISGPRTLQHLIVPDPYSFSWNDIGIKSYDEVISQISNISYKNENNKIKKVFWRGNQEQHFSRKKFIEYVKNNELFDVEQADPSQNTFVHMSEVGKFSTLIDFPGQGYSARLKYLIHSRRPVIVYPREEWDLFSMMLEPDIHYISSLPLVEDTTQRCVMSLHHDGLQKYYSSSSNRISQYFNEKNAILLLSNAINKWA